MSDLLGQAMQALETTTARPFDASAQERLASIIAATNSHYNAASAFTTAAWLYRRERDYRNAVRMTLHASALYRKAFCEDLANTLLADASRMAQKYGVTA